MTDPTAKALGRKIAFYRSQRGWSQRTFGALVDRSEAWVSQVERGARRIDRMTVLRRVADALEVPLSELAADTPIVAAASERPEPVVALRMLLCSSLALGIVVDQRPTTLDLKTLGADARRAWELAHATAYDELIPLLSDLVPRLESATRASTGRTQRSLFAILAKAYHACAAALSKMAETDAAWVAADRAIAAAERSGDRLLIAEGAFRLTLVFQAARQFGQAEHTAMTAVEALEPLAASGQPQAIALQGALRLQIAVVAARQNQPGRAYAELHEARSAAERLGVDRNDYDTEFGPTNVALHEVAVAVELGDAGTALGIAAGIDASRLSPERQGRLLIDVARAHLQRRNLDGVVHALLNAEKLTPEQIRQHGLVRSMLHDLARAGHGRDPRVRSLAARCGIRLA